MVACLACLSEKKKPHYEITSNRQKRSVSQRAIFGRALIELVSNKRLNIDTPHKRLVRREN